MAHLLNDGFTKTSADLKPLSPLTADKKIIQSAEYIISVKEVKSALQHIKINKSLDPDNIPNWLLKDLATTLSSPICAIFNSSVREQYVPDLWKMADLCPTCKGESS